MTLKVGLIGTGWFSKMHGELLAVEEGVEVVSICGSSKEKADQLAQQFDDARGYGKITDMLDSRKLDAVYICVPPFAHGEIEHALLQRGIPFLVEKPLGVDMEAPTSILKEVQKQQLITSIGYHFRYMDSTLKARHLLEGKTIGMALGQWMGGMPEVNWWKKQEGSGGQIVEQTTHLFDLLRYLLGEVTEVYAAYAHRVIHSKHDEATVADVGTVTLKLASGAVANLSNACMLSGGGTIRLNIYTDGNNLELTHGGLVEIAGENSHEYKNVSNPYVNETRAFLHAVRTGDTSGILSDYEDAWKSQRVTVAANESAQSGQPVKLADL
ncbi:Gfo/Idh/MocA family protein [Paenibacillus sp. GCM10012307]|uniref:Gfo/Idh/MocA family oxidoreductase n=1 Tax=Paenibacillus roseus TaxID=2798579 RepID=A0A934J212_9BACL|nr:Gfo/Idh/MocA family oxidoreductase [Paenibacillus roseus]MBJ6361350.1 Gfo/Idh/MocA family oxidoreductase [Paenibacillus roseus]